MFTPDTLSRAPLPGTDENVELLVREAEAYLLDLPATDATLEKIRRAQENDAVCSLITQFALHGWPELANLQGEVKKFFPFGGEITVFEGLLLRGYRLIIPQSLRQEMLMKIHQGHLGIVKCRERAKHSLWWPNLSSELENLKERGNRPRCSLKFRNNSGWSLAQICSNGEASTIS